MGTKGSFLTTLIFAGIFQGAVEIYFRLSARQAAIQYGYEPVIVGESVNFDYGFPWNSSV
jgi:hypothetical protein